MKNYTPPTPDDLMRLKDRLGMTQAEIAEYSGISSGAQWRKYTGGAKPRKMNPHMLFYIAAREVLEPDALGSVFQKMRDIGADL